jgi:uncharacterized protein (DUF3084 family)
MRKEIVTVKQENIRLQKENEELNKRLENACFDLKKLKLNYQEKLFEYEKLFLALSQKVALSIDAMSKEKEKLQPTREDYDRWVNELEQLNEEIEVLENDLKNVD